MKTDLKQDACDRWQFYRDWIPGKELAIWEPGNRWNSTARNRLNHIKNLPAYMCLYGFDEYNRRLSDIFAINTSTPFRQGREMSDGYKAEPTEKIVDNPCPNHTYHCFVVMYKDTACAYSIVHHMGEFANISTIIGHADYLHDGVMLMLTDALQAHAQRSGIKAMSYGTWDSGTDGLRYFKHSTGFQPQTIEI